MQNLHNLYKTKVIALTHWYHTVLILVSMCRVFTLSFSQQVFSKKSLKSLPERLDTTQKAPVSELKKRKLRPLIVRVVSFSISFSLKVYFTGFSTAIG